MEANQRDVMLAMLPKVKGYAWYLAPSGDIHCCKANEYYGGRLLFEALCGRAFLSIANIDRENTHGIVPCHVCMVSARTQGSSPSSDEPLFEDDPLPEAGKSKGKSRLASKLCYDEMYGDTEPFHSMLERRFYYWLKDREARDEVRNIRRQVRYNIVVNDYPICRYTTDFVYEELVLSDTYSPDYWIERVVDVKGYIAKDSWPFVVKLMRAVHNVDVIVWPRKQAKHTRSADKWKSEITLPPNPKNQ